MNTEQTEIDQPPFHSAQAAVRFAITFEGRPERPAMNRVPDKDDIYYTPKGLSGLDGAGQAGIIRRIMRELGRDHDAVLIARAVPHWIKCECKRPCCSGSEVYRPWQAAINVLTDAAGPVIKSRGYVRHEVRQALVMRTFGEPFVLKDLGEKYDLDEKTMVAYNAKIVRWIKGQKASVHYQAMEGIENIAWREIETALSKAGIVG